MTEWRVLIVDDDQTVASIHRRVVNAQPGFRVVSVASSSEQAHALIARGVPVDLLLLDLELPGASGVALLRALRRSGGPEVIAITACRERDTVQDLMRLGIVDYLVKPFAIDRLQQGLLRFRDRMRTLQNQGELEQAQIDVLYCSTRHDLLPKDLQPETLEAVRTSLRRGGERFLSAEEIGRDASVARVTARRYLEYLVSARQADMDLLHDGPGRPRKLYRLAAVA